MKKQIYWLAFALMALVLAGCEGNKKVEIDERLLPGRWEAPSQSTMSGEADAKLLLVFQEESCVLDGEDCGKWGYQIDFGDSDREDWDELEKIILTPQEREGDYHGNGWFGWKAQPGEIRTTQTMTGKTAVVPKTWEITAFSSSQMTLKENGKTYLFVKVK